MVSSIAELEKQCFEHGYQRTVKQDAQGDVVVTLKQTTTGDTFMGEGSHRHEDPYRVALDIAVARMLRYVNRLGGHR